MIHILTIDTVSRDQPIGKGIPSMTRTLRARPVAAVITSAIVGLTLTTSWIHLGLGGLLFTLNAVGYATLAAAIVIGAVAPNPLIARFSWLPRVGLAGFTLTTIVGYLVIGPYFALGFITKAVEVIILALLALDTVRVYGGPRGMARAVFASVGPLLPARWQPAE
jgi:hypothetical protein